MPRFNGTGPFGFGPGTGWGSGPCRAGMGLGRGFGRGFGGKGYFGYPYPPYYPERITKKEETEMLMEDAEGLERELKAVKERLAELKGQK